MTHSRTFNEYGEPIEKWTAGDETICGIEFHEGQENPMDDKTMLSYSATLRLPHDFEIDPKDRFLVTSYRGEAVSWTLEIITPLWTGMTGQRLGVNKIEL